MLELNAAHFLSLVNQIGPSSFEAAQQLLDTLELARLARAVNVISQEEYENVLDLITQRLSVHKSFPGNPSVSTTSY